MTTQPAELKNIGQEQLLQLWEGGLRKELDLEEEDLEAALGVANAKLQAGDTVTAQKIYSALALCEPGNFRFQQGLANFCLRTGAFDMALRTASAMVLMEPRNPTGYFISGAAALALGHPKEAKEDIADALAYAEKSGDAGLQAECNRLLQQIEAL